MTSIIISVAAAFALFNLGTELRRDLMMFQQNSYRSERYRRWLKASGDTTSAWRLCGIMVFLLVLMPLVHLMPGAILVAIFSAISGLTLFKRKYKKPLVMTPRAKRIYATSLFASALVCGAGVLLFGGAGIESRLFALSEALLLCYYISHMIILFAGAVLSPVEKSINNAYIRDAQKILAQMPDLKIIGITGSYGKTSTKHYLYRILSERYETLMTPGSYNTTLGVVRTVREMLKPYHEVFIVEMGAKQPDDIAEICRIVHPRRGIITAVGPQHLESFKTIERVQATKFELADALPENGLIVVNNDFEACASRPVCNVDSKRYGVACPGGCDYRATDVRYSPQGTSFTVEGPDGFRIELETRLIGECNIANLLGAVVMAIHLEVPAERIKYAVASIEQVEHRLSIRQTPGGITIIDDAFNSNPTGSRMAVDVLSHFKDGRRIIVTPGMIELGKEQFTLNKELGAHIGRNIDIAVIVGSYNRDAIVAGIRESGFDEQNLHIVDSFSESQTLLARLMRAGDTVLYENDLPDTFK